MAPSLKAGILWSVFVPPSPRLEQALGQHVWDEEKKNRVQPPRKNLRQALAATPVTWSSRGLMWLSVHPGQGSLPPQVPVGICSEAGSVLREDPPFHGAEPFLNWTSTYKRELSWGLNKTATHQSPLSCFIQVIPSISVSTCYMAGWLVGLAPLTSQKLLRAMNFSCFVHWCIPSADSALPL